MSWHSGSEFDLPFRPAAVRLLVRAEGGQQAEAELGDDDVRLVLRD